MLLLYQRRSRCIVVHVVHYCIVATFNVIVYKKTTRTFKFNC